MRILIVEDEVPVARQIAAALTEDGHDPTAVHSGEAALDELSKRPDRARCSPAWNRRFRAFATAA